TFCDSLITFIRSKLGKKGALVVAIFLSIGCIAWTLGLTAAVGKGVEILTGGGLSWQPIAVVTGICAILVGILHYDYVEKVMTGMMFLLLILYLVVAGACGLSWLDTVMGFIPTIPDTG